MKENCSRLISWVLPLKATSQQSSPKLRLRAVGVPSFRVTQDILHSSFKKIIKQNGPSFADRFVKFVGCWRFAFELFVLHSRRFRPGSRSYASALFFDGTTACEKPLLPFVFVLSTFFIQVPISSYKSNFVLSTRFLCFS